jgi:Heparinase II/III N-terminus/Heparinase II/III-like protein
MPTAVRTIEKPAHIDDRRMRHISDADLFAAVDLSRAGLGAVRNAVEHAGWEAAYQAWAGYLMLREQPVAVVSLDGYAGLDSSLRQARSQPILAKARQIAQTPVDFTGNSHGRTPLYGVHYMLWLLPLLQAYALDRDPAHIETFVRLFNQWYETRDQVVGEIESLDVIWYTLGLAQRSLVFTSAYQAFRQSPLLDARTQARLLKSLLGAGRWLAEEHDRFLFGNWQVTGVCALYELGVIWPELLEAPVWRTAAWQRILEHLELDVTADGGHSERSPSYHQHVLACLARVASVAELNGQPPLQTQARFAAMYRWLLEQTTPLGCTTNFNDSHLVWPGQWAVQGAVLLEDPGLKWLAEQLGSRDEIDWTLAGLPNRPGGAQGAAARVYARLATRRPRLASTLLATSKFAILRSGLAPDDLFMAINYGPLVGHEYESHSHLDTLSFVCSGLGRPLAVEAGLPLTSYDDPLYKTWIRSAAAHNMVLVDRAEPDEQKKEGELLFWSTSAVADFFEAEHAGYEARGVRHRRSILFIKGEYWIVYDELVQTGSHRLDWLIYTPGPFVVDAGRLQPTQAPGLAVLPVLPVTGSRFEPAQGLMAVAGPRAYEGSSAFREVQGMSHVQETAEARAVYLHVLYPVHAAAECAALAARPVACGQDGGQACSIQHSGGADLFLRRACPGGPAAAVRVQGWHSDTRVAWLRSRECWAVFDASTLQAGELPVFQSSSRLTALSLGATTTGLAGEAQAMRQTEITLFVEGEVQDAYLNAVRLPASRVTGQAVRLLLLAGGHYHFEIIRHS